MRFSARNIVVVLVLLIVLLTFTGAFFIVNETKQAIVLQFGEPRQLITKPGLQFKIPFIQDAVFLDRRMLNLDPQPEEMILSDQNRIVVDSFARYKITDPLKFFQTVRNETTFSDRFGRIINAAVRGVIAQYSLTTLLSAERVNIMNAIQKLSKTHDLHMKHYGKDNDKRMTGLHETASYDKFTYGVADRSASIRIPSTTKRNQCGYLEDRRPAANIDPYICTSLLLETVCE